MTYPHWLDLIKHMICMQQINPSLTLQLLQMGWLLQLNHHHSPSPIMKYWGSAASPPPPSKAWCHEKASARPVQQTGAILAWASLWSQYAKRPPRFCNLRLAAQPPPPGILSGASSEYTLYRKGKSKPSGSTNCSISHVALLFYYYSPRIGNTSHWIHMRKPNSWVFRAFPYGVIQAPWKEAETKFASSVQNNSAFYFEGTDHKNENYRQISTRATR